MQETFGHYTIIKNLKTHPSYFTYLAHPTEDPKKKVIIKSYIIADKQEQKTFLENCKLLTDPKQQAIIPLLDYGTEQGETFTVREYFPYGTLDTLLSLLQPQQLQLDVALKLITHVGDGIAKAHEEQLIHKYICRNNILIDQNGWAYIGDFHIEPDFNLNLLPYEADNFTFSYAAPEQFQMSGDAKSDQYALGCLTYELITGAPPFGNQDLTSMWMLHNMDDPIPLDKLIPHFPEGLSEAILKTLAKQPDERYPDVSDFVNALKAFIKAPDDLNNDQPLDITGTANNPATSNEIQTPEETSQPAKPTPDTENTANDAPKRKNIKRKKRKNAEKNPSSRREDMHLDVNDAQYNNKEEIISSLANNSDNSHDTYFSEQDFAEVAINPYLSDVSETFLNDLPISYAHKYEYQQQAENDTPSANNYDYQPPTEHDLQSADDDNYQSPANHDLRLTDTYSDQPLPGHNLQSADDYDYQSPANHDLRLTDDYNDQPFSEHDLQPADDYDYQSLANHDLQLTDDYDYTENEPDTLQSTATLSANAINNPEITSLNNTIKDNNTIADDTSDNNNMHALSNDTNDIYTFNDANNNDIYTFNDANNFADNEDKITPALSNMTATNDTYSYNNKPQPRQQENDQKRIYTKIPTIGTKSTHTIQYSPARRNYSGMPHLANRFYTIQQSSSSKRLPFVLSTVVILLAIIIGTTLFIMAGNPTNNTNKPQATVNKPASTNAPTPTAFILTQGSPTEPTTVATATPKATIKATPSPQPAVATKASQPVIKPTAASVATPIPTPTPTPASTTTSVTSYQAEARANSLGGNAEVITCDTCSGGAGVDSNRQDGYSLTFNGIVKNAAGNYKLTIYYAFTNSNGLRNASVTVNGTELPNEIYMTSTGSWTTIGSYTLTVNLAAGDNSIELSGYGYAPLFDYITV